MEFLGKISKVEVSVMLVLHEVWIRGVRDDCKEHICVSVTRFGNFNYFWQYFAIFLTFLVIENFW
jgi:hypothetical protein